MNGYGQYQPDYAQNDNSKWAYHEAKNYSDWESVQSAFPHLKGINSEEECEKGQKVNGIVIRSANDDNVHKVRLGTCRPSSSASGRPPQRTRARSSSFGNENSPTASIPTCFSAQ